MLDFYLTVAFPFAVDTATVSLVVEPKFFGEAVAFPEARSEILIVESHSFFFSKLISQLPQQVMFLIRADEQGSSKSFEASSLSDLGGFRQPQPVTIGAAVALMSHNSLKVLQHVVAVSYNKRQVIR